MSNNVTLRALLFETLNGLKNNSIDLDRVKAINDTAQILINCAKVEVDYMRTTGQQLSNGFIDIQQQNSFSELTQNGIQNVERVPGGAIITHKLR